MYKSIIKKLTYLDKQTRQMTEPNVVIIDRNHKKNCWEVKEQYFNYKTAEVDFKYYYYDDYNEYLEKVKLSKDTPVILFDF